MSKKKPVDKRLNKLFENIKPEDTGSESQRAAAGQSTAERDGTPAVHLEPIRQVTDHTRPLEIMAPALQPRNGMAMAFQTGRNDWATLQVVDETNQRRWNTDDELLVRQVADQLSLALENARLFQETQTRATELSVLNEVGQALAATLNIEQITEITYGGIHRLFDARNFYIAFYNREKNEIVFPHNVTDSVVDRSITRLPLDKGITAHMIRTRESLLIGDGSDKWMQEHGETPVGEPAKSFLGVPLILGDNVLGAIAIQDYHTPNRYDDHDLRLLKSFANQAAIALQNAGLFQEVTTSQGQLSEALRIGRMGYFEYDLPTRLLTITDEMFLLLDTSSGQEGGSQFPVRRILRKFVVNEDIPAILKSIQELSQHPELRRMAREIRLKRRTGGISWVQAIYTIEMNQAGEYTKIVGSAQDITDRKNNELTQAAISNITEGALRVSTVTELIKIVHESVSTLMPARDFYAAMYDEQTDSISFPYYQNEYGNFTDHQKLLTGFLTPQQPGSGLTSYVLRTGKPLLCTPDVYAELERAGLVEGEDVRKTDWLGVPLKRGNQRYGVMAIRTYTTEMRLTEIDRDNLMLIANQVSLVIERLKSREALAKSEADFRALFASMQDVVMVIDRDTRYVRIAPTNPSRLFLPPSELLGKRMDQILPAETHVPFRNAIHKALDTNEVVQIEYELPIEGQSYWFLANLSKLSTHEVFWVARDITERKKSEEALQRRNTHLAASAEIGRLVTSTLDLNTIFSQTVNLLADRFGYYFAAIYNIEETGFNAILRGATGEAGARMMAEKQSIVVGSQTIVGLVAESGKPRRVEDVRQDPFHLENQHLPGTLSEVAIPLRVGQRTVGVIDIHSNQLDAFTEDDLSVLQSLADQVAVAIDNARSYELSQQLIKDLREIDKLKSQFLANMSHELRTPLNSIIGFSRVILKGIDGPITEMQQQDLSAIYNSGQHLLGLINDILDLARIEAGKMELNFEEINLGEMVTSVLSTAKGLVKEKQIHLLQNVPAAMPTVRGDTMRVRQVFINLLSNASKFTDTGTIRVETQVQRNPSGKMEALINVIDTGAGISQEDQEKLFKAFSQVDGSATRKTGGSGLGLSICANLVQLHGGRIGVHSEAGKGSTFWFTLPLFHQPFADIPTGKKVVLAIDDDPQVVNLLERHLNPLGYYVLPVTDITKIKQRVLEIKPYAITLDIMMQHTNGWSLLTDLKSDPETRDFPVIVCSILDQADRGFNLGATDYLVKPILEADFLHALKRMNKHGTIHNVLVIDDDPNDLRLIEKFLGGQAEYKPMVAEGGRKGWEAIHASQPDAIILDIFMPDMDGFTILEKLRGDPALRDIPVLVVSGGGLTNEQHQQLRDLGRRLITHGSVKEGDLFASIEHALSRIKA